VRRDLLAAPPREEAVSEIPRRAKIHKNRMTTPSVAAASQELYPSRRNTFPIDEILEASLFSL
jgi:chromosomal replication initiation ATPase DnaA